MPDTVDTLFSSPRLWFNETAEEFESLRAELQREVRCNGVIEKIYVNDMAELLFEIRRLRYSKSDMIFKARPEALISIIKQCLLKDSMKLSAIGIPPDAGPLAKSYSRDFLENGRHKQKVLDMLRDAGLDERAIDAEACRQVFSELQMVDKLLVSAEARFSRALRAIAEYRKSFALTIEAAAKEILADDLPRLAPAAETSG